MNRLWLHASVAKKPFCNLMQEGADKNLLRAVEVEIVDREACQKLYESKKITSRMVCAGVPGGGKDSCQRDSGGALVIKKSGKQVGIVSWGRGCAGTKYPGVYSNVADKEIYDFIEIELKKVT